MAGSNSIPTEPIGSIPRPLELIAAVQAFSAGDISQDALDEAYDSALKDTIQRFEATDSPVITDGEQTKPSFATYPLAGMSNLAPDGVTIPFEDGHTRQLPRLTSGPFHYQVYAGAYTQAAKRMTQTPVKQAVIAASALSLLYPQDGIDGYAQDAFTADLIGEAVKDIRSALDNGAYNVQIDFTEGRLACKLDPSKGLLNSFIDLNNQVLGHFSAEEQQRIGVHTCPGGDHDSTHSADVDYAELLPSLFSLNAGNFYIQMASEKDPATVLGIIKANLKSHQRAFIGVIDPINEEIETPETVRDRVLQAAAHIPVDQLGTTDDCGFSPFGDDVSTARDTAFEKIRARVVGTQMAAEKLGL